MSPNIIRVLGAHENNLRGIDVDIPKRQLTVFTGVSGSGKSSLVFGTIAAESQRLINETYSTFVQGFMPTLARPDVDHLEGITTAIIVDQEPMGANSRSTVGTATDATAMLRILFSRIAEPSAGGPGAYSFNVPSVSASGAIAVGEGKKERVDFKRTGGQCPTCEGMGRVSDIDLTQLIDVSLSLNDGALLVPGYKVGSWVWKTFAESGLYPADIPIAEFTEAQRHALLDEESQKIKFNGFNYTYDGLVVRVKKSILSKDRDSMQKAIGEFVDRAVTFVPCPSCGGTRLAQHALESRIMGKNIAELCAMEIRDLAEWMEQVENPSVAPLITAIQETLRSFVEIGLGYLTLDRPAGTLSGGEAQRTKMIRHLGSALTDITYVFDEPTAGLHPHDIERMNKLLLELRDKGNTVLVVEHKPETIAIADHVVDLGPGAGSAGGQLQYQGPLAGLRGAGTITGQHLDDRAKLKDSVREGSGAIEIRGASRNNLRDVDVDIPLGVLTAITGVAGSGKSSLVGSLPAREDMVIVDQSPIRGSRRSNPATYTGALEPIRKAFAKAHGVKPALFSPNSEGACPNCKGAGVVYVDLGIMSGVDLPCEVCEGRRFDDAVLHYLFGGKDIAEVLQMPAAEAAEFFASAEAKVPAAAKICARLVDVGLGYITLGQPLTTLSGGERQRLKLASHLGEKANVFILDEPTTGLHLADVDTLLALLDRMVEQGKTVVCIEHHLAVVAHADHVIDVGPGAGTDGGTIAFTGTPAEMVAEAATLTGRYLKEYVG
ncbi:UvrABC system protein A [Corynebacterium atrinae]|uniref:excinuclease ABC subunit UvrA n=1 Tax=Corynebacterium atrinae TaxID=1336740 RepID=UPI0025B3B246|nr:excinuclease ABC subunit UvrA [Corynebacterium atrinae]WJY62992.1 UvrABC system protein A [Corynebacterium atrinae]